MKQLLASLLIPLIIILVFACFIYIFGKETDKAKENCKLYGNDWSYYQAYKQSFCVNRQGELRAVPWD